MSGGFQKYWCHTPLFYVDYVSKINYRTREGRFQVPGTVW